MLTPRDGYPISRLPLKQKVTLLVDSVTRCNGPTTVTPSTDILAQVAQVVILIRINIYILFSVVAAVGGVPAADLSFNSQWYRPHGYHPREGVTPTMWVPAEVIHAGAISLNWRHSSWRLYLKLGCRLLGLYPSLGYQTGPYGPKWA